MWVKCKQQAFHKSRAFCRFLSAMGKNMAANKITCSHILICQHVSVCVKPYAVAGRVSEHGKISLSFRLDFCLGNCDSATMFQHLPD